MAYSGKPVFQRPMLRRNLGLVRKRGMGDILPCFLDPTCSGSAPADTSSAPSSGYSIDWNNLFSTAAQAATSIYQLTTAADIAKIQAEAQARNPLIVRPTGSTSPIFSTGNIMGGNMTPVLVLAGLGVAAYFILK